MNRRCGKSNSGPDERPGVHASALAGRVRVLLCALSGGILLGFLGGLGEVHAQNYLDLGFYRNAEAVLRLSMGEGLVIALCLALAVLFVHAVAVLFLGRRIGSPSALGIACTFAGAFLLRFGWEKNRYVFAKVWKAKREILGIPVPGGLVDRQVLLTNLGIVLSSALLSLLLYFTFRFFSHRLADSGFSRRCRAVQFPLVVGAGCMLLFPALVVFILAGRKDVSGPNVVLLSLDTLRAGGPVNRCVNGN